MTNIFKLTNCILGMIIVLLVCSYILLAQNIQQDLQINQNYLLKTVAAFNA